MITNHNKQLINELLALPDAPVILKEINAILEEERTRRNTFYNNISEFEKAEFINGEIIIHSPVKKEHNDVTGSLYQLLNTYVKKKKLGYVGYEKIMISLSRNDYEPDICFFQNEKAQTFKKGQSLFPAPDLVIEVLSTKTAGNDRGIKFSDYQAHQIQEYWIIDPDKEILEQYRLNDQNEYELILKARKGMLDCVPVNGFKIEIEAVFDEDKNLEELLRILNL